VRDRIDDLPAHSNASVAGWLDMLVLTLVARFAAANAADRSRWRERGNRWFTFTPRSCSSNTVAVEDLIVRHHGNPGGTHIGVFL
jgi:hypothetical protein